MKKIGKKWSVVNGNTAMQINEKEVDVMEQMSEAQTADVMAPATETAATPQVAEANQPEKVGILTRVGNGIKSTGQKLWNNRGKIAFVGGVLSTIAGAVVYDRIRNGEPQPEMAVPEYDIPDSDEQSETSETTENTEVE